MLFALGLGLLGLILIYFEFFVPGGIIGAIGGILLLGSVVVFVMNQGGFIWILSYIIILIALLIFVIRFALWRVRCMKHSIFLSADQEGYRAPSFDQTLIGKTGKTLTNLNPAGHIIIDDHQYQALSRSRYIEKGEPIEVIGGKGSHLIVKKYKQETS